MADVSAYLAATVLQNGIKRTAKRGHALQPKHLPLCNVQNVRAVLNAHGLSRRGRHVRDKAMRYVSPRGLPFRPVFSPQSSFLQKRRPVLFGLLSSPPINFRYQPDLFPIDVIAIAENCGLLMTHASLTTANSANICAQKSYD